MEIISQKEAKKQNLRFYFTGKSCKRGHIVPRYVASGDCEICSKNRRAIYRTLNEDKLKLWFKDHHKKTYTTEKRRSNGSTNSKSLYCG